MRKSRQKYGFTLAEILIALFIFSMASLMMVVLLSQAFRGFKDGRVLIALQQNTRKAIEIMASEWRELYIPPGPASRIADISGGSPCPPWQTCAIPYVCSGNTITFHKVDPFVHCAGSSAVTPGGDETITFTLSGGAVTRQSCGARGTTTTITTPDITVNALTFAASCVHGSPAVSLTMTAQKQATNITKTLTLQTQASPRLNETFSP